jgi:carboxyl-terminal processing protease
MKTRSDREFLINKIESLVREKHYDPQFGGQNWSSIVETHRPQVVAAETPSEFESAVAAMLKEVGSGALGLLNEKTKVNSRNSISASFRSVDTCCDGLRWVFQDVAPGGPAALAGIQSADALLTIDGQEVRPPQRPAFAMSESFRVVVSRGPDGKVQELIVNTPRSKHRDNPCAEPESVTASFIDNTGIVKVSLFPGKLGIDFANRISALLSTQLKDVDRLIIDLRGNPGGGIGGLRLMSYLTPGIQPIGFSLDRRMAERGYDRDRLPRFGRIPKSKWQVPFLALRFAKKQSVVLETEGLGEQKFHGRVAVLVNEHTTCAAEMVAQFAQEQRLAQVIGMATPGRLVSHSGFDVGYGYTLVVPVAAYVSWRGNRLDGNGIQPDVCVDWSYSSSLLGFDHQLDTVLNNMRNISVQSASC